MSYNRPEDKDYIYTDNGTRILKERGSNDCTLKEFEAAMNRVLGGKKEPIHLYDAFSRSDTIDDTKKYPCNKCENSVKDYDWCSERCIIFHQKTY